MEADIYFKIFVLMDKKKVIKDSDLLRGMEMMLDYEPVVYGYSQHYYYTNLAEESAAITEDTHRFDEHSLDEEYGKMWKDNCLDENNLEDSQVEYLKNALWLYYY